MRTIKTIAIIDDDEIYQFTIKRTIQASKIAAQICSFFNGKEALDFLIQHITHAENLPDIIFLDLNMPVLNGWEFLDKYFLLKPKIQKRIYIYIVTSSNNSDDLQRAKTIAEVCGYIVKPLTVQKLESIVDSVEETQTVIKTL